MVQPFFCRASHARGLIKIAFAPLKTAARIAVETPAKNPSRSVPLLRAEHNGVLRPRNQQVRQANGPHQSFSH